MTRARRAEHDSLVPGSMARGALVLARGERQLGCGVGAHELHMRRHDLRERQERVLQGQPTVARQVNPGDRAFGVAADLVGHLRRAREVRIRIVVDPSPRARPEQRERAAARAGEELVEAIFRPPGEGGEGIGHVHREHASDGALGPRVLGQERCDEMLHVSGGHPASADLRSGSTSMSSFAAWARFPSLDER